MSQLFTYVYKKQVNPDKMDLEVRQSSLTGFDHLDVSGNQVIFAFKHELDAESQSVLNDLVNFHDSADVVPIQSTLVNILEIPPYAINGMEASYFKQSFHVLAGPGIGSFVTNISWPYDITILGGRFPTLQEHVGDNFKVEIAPMSLVGQLTEAVPHGSNTLVVDSNCAEYYVWKCDQIFLFDGQNNIPMGVITKKSARILTMSQTAPADFPPGMGVKVNTQIVPYLHVVQAQDTIEIGRKTQRAMFIPANLPMVVTYTSNSVVNDSQGNPRAKDVCFNLEWYG